MIFSKNWTDLVRYLDLAQKLIQDVGLGFPNTQRDFEQLIVSAYETGRAALTFAADLRINLGYDDGRWMFVAHPMSDRATCGVDFGIMAMTGLTITQAGIRGLTLNDQRPFAHGRFSKLSEEVGPLGGKHFVADWIAQETMS